MAPISVKSNPVQVELYLDGVMMRLTPDKMDRIKPGEHLIKVLKTGFNFWEKELDLSTELFKSMDVKLESIGTVIIRTEIIEAQIQVDLIMHIPPLNIDAMSSGNFIQDNINLLRPNLFRLEQPPTYS